MTSHNVRTVLYLWFNLCCDGLFGLYLGAKCQENNKWVSGLRFKCLLSVGRHYGTLQTINMHDR